MLKDIVNNITIMVLIIIQSSCLDNDDHTFYQSPYTPSKRIVEIDSIVIKNSDSTFISRVNDINIWNNSILITDRDLNRVNVYSKRSELEHILGRKGEGPEEFLRSPIIFTDKDSLYLIDILRKKIFAYDNKFIYRSINSLPINLVYMNQTPIRVGKDIIYPACVSKDYRNKNVYEETKLLYRIDHNYNIVQEFYDWEDEYYKLSAFSLNSLGCFVAKKGDNSFFGIQRASWVITYFDSDNKPLKRFGLKPKYFKDPPTDITFNETQKSVEALVSFSAQITDISKLKYDEENDYLFVYYYNGTEDRFNKRSDLYAEHYLQIYDKNYYCIFDNKIPGIFEFIDKGRIYVMTEENPSYIKMKILELRDL